MTLVFEFLKSVSVDVAVAFYYANKKTKRTDVREIVSVIGHDDIWQWWFKRDMPELWKRGERNLRWSIPLTLWETNDWQVYYLWHRLAWKTFKSTANASAYFYPSDQVEKHLKQFPSLSEKMIEIYVAILRPFFKFYTFDKDSMRDALVKDDSSRLLLADVPNIVEIKRKGVPILGKCVQCGTLEFV